MIICFFQFLNAQIVLSFYTKIFQAASDRLDDSGCLHFFDPLFRYLKIIFVKWKSLMYARYHIILGAGMPYSVKLLLIVVHSFVI
jgi:hypothetical protein